MKRIALVVLSAYLNLTSAHAFEITTHGKITLEAWLRFLDENPGVLDRLGIQDKANAFDTDGYYDYRPVAGVAPVSRSAHSFEGAVMDSNAVGVATPLSLRGWLIRGAIREDDDSSSDDPSPKEDPYGNFHRVFSHFYDPVNNRGLTVLGQTLGAKAADWALDPNAFTPAFALENLPQRYNHFGLANFRESLWRAVTGLNQAGAPIAPTASERNLYWATAFRALGDILHLNQDMAQPQHTRNDPHAGGLFTGVTGHKSVLERYLEARVTGARGFSTRDDANTPNVNIVVSEFNSFGGYLTPKFTRYADYWSTADFKGLANYSNRGFFSIGTLPSNTSYPSPSTDVASYPTLSETVTQWDGSPYQGGTYNATLYTGSVPDAQLGQPASNVRLFARSAWDEACQGICPPWSRITLVKANYDDAINLLIPRAVAYSAGILQYAFRGKLEISLPDEGVYGVVDHNDAAGNTKDTGGFPKIKMKLRNLTPAATGVEAMGPGKLRAVARFHRNTCYDPTLSGEYGSPGIDWRTCRSVDEEIVVSEEVVTAGITDVAQPVTFLFPTRIPINASDLYLQVVYRGQLGEESDTVVVAIKDISEPTYRYNYSRWDQYMYAQYPSVSSGPYTWAEWCAQGYASLDTCNSSMGLTQKERYSPTASPIPGYDPATAAVPPGSWADLSLEPPFTPFATLPAPVGTLARIAVMGDASPTNFGLMVLEWISTSLTGSSSIFQWLYGTLSATINQRDPTTDTLTPSVTYLPGRGVYLPAEENFLLTSGTAPNIPPLILVPSQINF